MHSEWYNYIFKKIKNIYACLLFQHAHFKSNLKHLPRNFSKSNQSIIMQLETDYVEYFSKHEHLHRWAIAYCKSFLLCLNCVLHNTTYIKLSDKYRDIPYDISYEVHFSYFLKATFSYVTETCRPPVILI